MTLTLLISASLLALVATARPILPQADLNQDHYVGVRSTLRNIPESRAGRSPTPLFPTEENIYVQATSPQQQIAYLAQPDDAAVKSVAHLAPVNTQDGSLLYDALGSSSDGANVRPVIDSNGAAGSPVSGGKAQPSPSDDKLTPTTAPRLVVLITSCIAALVGLLGICIALYIITVLRSRVLTSQNSWEMLSLIREAEVKRRGNGNLIELKPRGSGALLLINADIAPAELPDTLSESNTVDNLDLITFQDELVAEEISSDNEEVTEFEDAISDPPTPQLGFLPEIRLFAAENDHSSPLELENLPISRSPTRTLLEMREATASAVARPAWSLRADEDTSLFVPSPSSPSRSSSAPAPPLPPPASDTSVITDPVPRQRAYRSPVPEFDIALAMQLRPGLGLGADSAWMVRFLMAMFGWFTVLLTGRKELQQRRLAA